MKIRLFLAFFLLITVVFAQDFEVAPVVINFNANPGEIQKQTVTIRNHANFKQAFNFKLGDFEVGEDGKKKRIPAGESPRSCADWITITPSFIELTPNEVKEITVIMTVPKNGFSSKWGMIYVQATTEQTEDPVDKQLATGIKITPRIVILVNQSPKLNNKYVAKISSLKEVTTTEDTLRTFNATVENIGDKIVEAKVHLAVANLSTAQEKKFPPTMLRIYPGEKRIFTLTLPENIGSGKHALAAILDYGHATNLEGTQILIDL